MSDSEKMRSLTELANQAVDNILKDLKDRRGLSLEWSWIEKPLREEIKAIWVKEVHERMLEAQGRPLTEKLKAAYNEGIRQGDRRMRKIKIAEQAGTDILAALIGAGWKPPSEALGTIKTRMELDRIVSTAVREAYDEGFDIGCASFEGKDE